MHRDIIEKGLPSLIKRSVNAVFKDLEIPRQDLKIELEIPKEKSHGDLATNIAMRLAKIAFREPLVLADLILGKMKTAIGFSKLKSIIGDMEVKPPGFINFFLKKEYLHEVLPEIERRKDDFGRSEIGCRIKLQIEFVSANPTGPLTVAHGRQAAIGDSLAKILEFLGYGVTKEYYINDEGVQMDTLANSIKARYLELSGKSADFPQDGYKGSYVVEIAKAFRNRYGDKFIGTQDLKIFLEFGLKSILDEIKDDLGNFGVQFDVWYSQKALRGSGKIEKALSCLREKGLVYEKENAVWFKSQDFGDDKDRVIVKSDGNPTYLAPDIAYHLDKYRRGFDRIINIWGPDHHGYIPRIKAAVQALGFPGDSLTVLIVQLATLYRSGKVVSMSTRAGEFVTLREVMDEVGKDVARFCFIMRRISSHLDFDLDAVKKESMENPVYYIQYAHARIWSILEHSGTIKPSGRFDPDLLEEPEELDILRTLRQFPVTVALSGKALEPYIILQYLQNLAAEFHSFYTRHRVVSDDHNLTKARLVLVDCVRIVLANGLRLLGVSLPKKM